MASIVRHNFKNAGGRRVFGLMNCHFSSAASTSETAAVKSEPLRVHRTSLDPNSFTTRNIGQWYTIPVSNLSKLSFMKTLPSRYAQQVETLLECSFMVRPSFVDLMNCLRHTNVDGPAPRYVIYGAYGMGKSVTLWQTANWAVANDWVVCYVPMARVWNRRPTEVTGSSWKADRFDLPLLAAEWLHRFKVLNEDVINQRKLMVATKDYTWTARENTPMGSPLMALVEQGIARPKFAADCFGALMRELKQHAREKRVKVMIAIDGVNAFFHETRHRRPDGNYMHASELTLVHNMKKMCLNDWTNGIVVTTVDNRAEGMDAPNGYLPYFLLGQEGFEFLDPFVPIEMKEYSEHEASSCLDYYIEKNWIQRPSAKTEDGRREIIHISGRNPLVLETTIASY